MKVAKIVALSITALLCNNVQSMELPNEYLLEKQLVDGFIPVQQYLAISEETSGDRWMLRNLRTAIYMTGDNLYIDLIHRINDRLQDVREMLQTMTEEEKLEEEKNLLYDFREIIFNMHKVLQKMIFRDDARMPNLS